MSGDRKNRNKLILILSLFVVFMGIGYAIISQTLTISGSGTISGDWNIFIESITPTDTKGRGESIRNNIGSDKLSATFEADLYMPNDYVEYTVVVKNNGTMNAELSNINLSSEKSNEYINFSHTATVGTVLNSGNTINFKVKVFFKDIENYTTIDQSTSSIVKLQLNFIQKTTSSSPSGGGTVVASNWEYEEIQNNGVGTGNYRITGYKGDFDTDTTSVVVTENAVTAEALTRIDTVMTTFGITVGAASNANYKGYALTIPSIIDGHPITSIGPNAFNALNGGIINYKYLNITSITIPEGITTIEDSNIDPSNGILTGAFLGNMNLKNLSLPSSLTKIGNGAFQTNALESITLPNNLITIGKYSFGMHNMTSLTIPATVTTIGDYAFQTPYELTEGITTLILPSDGALTTIGNYAFSENNLAEVDIPLSVTTIGKQAFSKNNLTTLTFPAYGALTTIGNYAFDNNNLTTVTIPSTVTNIGSDAFTDNPSLTSIIVDRSATGMTLGGKWCGIDDCTATGGRVTYN